MELLAICYMFSVHFFIVVILFMFAIIYVFHHLGLLLFMLFKFPIVYIIIIYVPIIYVSCHLHFPSFTFPIIYVSRSPSHAKSYLLYVVFTF